MQTLKFHFLSVLVFPPSNSPCSREKLSEMSEWPFSAPCDQHSPVSRRVRWCNTGLVHDHWPHRRPPPHPALPHHIIITDKFYRESREYSDQDTHKWPGIWQRQGSFFPRLKIIPSFLHFTVMAPGPPVYHWQLHHVWVWPHSYHWCVVTVIISHWQQCF